MSFVFIAFISSLVVLTGLVLHKILEIKKGKTLIPKNVLSKTDVLLQEQINLHKDVIVGGSKRGVKALSSITKESAKHLFLVFAHFLHRKLTEWIIKLRGKSFKQRSGVSFFLKRMEEYKDEAREGMREGKERAKKIFVGKEISSKEREDTLER